MDRFGVFQCACLAVEVLENYEGPGKRDPTRIVLLERVVENIFYLHDAVMWEEPVLTGNVA